MRALVRVRFFLEKRRDASPHPDSEYKAGPAFAKERRDHTRQANQQVYEGLLKRMSRRVRTMSGFRTILIIPSKSM
jgi:hypothetical protein